MGTSVFRFGEQMRGRRLRYKPSYGITGSRYVALVAPEPQNASVRLPRAFTGGYHETYPCKHIAGGHVPGLNYEDESFEKAVTESIEVAFERMRGEAQRLRAHGVVGVRRFMERSSFLGSTAPSSHIRLIGTAVRTQHARDLTRPFTSNLSAQSFAKLVSGGWIPIDVVIGVGAVRSHLGCVGSPEDPYGRQEFAQRADAMRMSRELAISQLSSSSTAEGETQVVGTEQIGPFGGKRDTLFEYSLLGTELLRYRDVPPDTPWVGLSASASFR
jgi:uncharacterized protein YbjQ (UPF0145 family)